ncbi:hypothetical protein GCM10007079_10140 [Nocardiopsis terrae]|nr:hypothetical protein GCM10007079_10140 [Nocardiopsis terrae]
MQDSTFPMVGNRAPGMAGTTLGTVQPMSSSYQEYSVNLPKDLVDEARGRSGDSGLSSYLEQALRHRVEQERLHELATWMQEANGPVSDEAIQQVHDEIDRAHTEQGVVPGSENPGREAA